ncbi:Phosphoribulokinase [Methylophaga frappieri]|uniref:phosphoribulokinase n=1 Tax=Methylophaga frappieri (strain ATCC BAA-2434 / DSM 25690 / JAM7) TaxID=754477 RepID=I1YJY6_METFJ|nr:phosphoribulokinase [Methylophaga frappieri]AFJ03229.1 Phosphoribulokinase [Methylophaga frappieri]
MSVAHPIIAVTGSSGAGTSTVKQTFADIFAQLHLDAVMIQGDSFHRYDRQSMQAAVEHAAQAGWTLTHFGPQANDLVSLESLFANYAASGQGQYRHYVHDAAEAAQLGSPVGQFTSWQSVPPATDLLFYEGLHGAAVTDLVNIAQFADLLIGVAPVINLEWVQKIQRDCLNRGYSQQDVADIIEKRMPDYIRYITPQFSRTHINFQRLPLVDTANPFAVPAIPAAEESLCVIGFQTPPLEMGLYLSAIPSARQTSANSLVVPGPLMAEAMRVIIMPIIEKMIKNRREMS